MQKDVYKSL